MIKNATSILLSIFGVVIFAERCEAQSFYMRCEREKNCLGNDSCVPQSGSRMFRINPLRKSVFDYVSGISTYWTDLKDWRTSTRDPLSRAPLTTYLRWKDPAGNRILGKDIVIYTPPEKATGARIAFGDAYDWTSSFERERPHKFRYSYSMELAEYSYANGLVSTNMEYGYCNMQN